MSTEPSPVAPAPSPVDTDELVIEDPAEPEPEMTIEDYEPYQKWLTAWEVPDGYLTLAQVQAKIGDEKLQDVLPLCQCLGFTMHIGDGVREPATLPPKAWSSAEWQWDVEENRCGRRAHGEHLQFQIAVFEEDVGVVLGMARPEPEQPERPAPPELVVEELEYEGLPEGWSMRTVSGIGWQSFQGPVNSPIRLEAGHAVGDAWSFSVNSKWT